MIHISESIRLAYPDVYSPEAMSALRALAPLDREQKAIMATRNERRKRRIDKRETLTFLDASSLIEGTDISVQDARDGKFEGSDIPWDLKRQWIQGTGPATKPFVPTEKSLRNVAYALLSGADGWMFDGEDALGQVETMSLDNIRNLKLAIDRDELFLTVAEQVASEMNRWSADFFKRPVVQDWESQLDFTTVIFRARGLHLDDRHIINEQGGGFSASITDLCLYVANNYRALQIKGSSIVLYLPKIQTAAEAAFWNKLLTTLEDHLELTVGTIKCYVLIEQVEATFQLMEIRAALGKHFVGFNTGRWDYINSVADALCGHAGFINPNIESIGMTYAYMAAYEDRVRRAVNTPDLQGRFALWQGGMEPNIPVGSAKGVNLSMEKALTGAAREEEAGASGKWVAHWKMVHIIRPVWEEKGRINQLGRGFPSLGYTEADANALMQLTAAPRTIRGARNLLSVALQYGNAFLQGQQAAALKPADFFGNDDVLYLMEDAATGEIRVSVLWEWRSKKGKLTEDDAEMGLKAGTSFENNLFEQLLKEEYQKLLDADSKDVYDSSKETTLPIAKEIVARCVTSAGKAPWYIDLLNLNLNNDDLAIAKARIDTYFKVLTEKNERISKNIDHQKRDSYELSSN